MPTMLSTRPEKDVLQRLLSRGKPAMSASLARHILQLGFTDEEQQHMESLATRQQEEGLSQEDHQELMEYVKAGQVLALLQLQARRHLHRKRVS